MHLPIPHPHLIDGLRRSYPFPPPPCANNAHVQTMRGVVSIIFGTINLAVPFSCLAETAGIVQPLNMELLGQSRTKPLTHVRHQMLGIGLHVFHLIHHCSRVYLWVLVCVGRWLGVLADPSPPAPWLTFIRPTIPPTHNCKTVLLVPKYAIPMGTAFVQAPPQALKLPQNLWAHSPCYASAA